MKSNGKALFSELSRKAQKRVNKSLRLFNKFSTLESDYSFEQTEAGAIDYFVRDPITGITASGDISYNNLGFMTESAGLGKYEDGTPDFYYSVEYFGRKGFKKHTKAAYNRGDELTEIIVKHGYSKQRVADWFDELPGANPYDPYSTVIDFGQTNNFAFA